MYTKFRFIGVAIDTSAVKGINAYPDVAHMPVNDNLPYDIKNRLRKVANLVNDAYNTIDRTQKNVLNIFTLPEFYFRPYDAQQLDNPGYDEAHIKRIVRDDSDRNKEFLKTFAQETSYTFADMQNIYAELLKMFRKKELEDWLFLPGTIFSKLESSKEGDTVYLNTLPIIKGGEGPAFATVVQKKLISRIDGADTNAAPYLDQNLRMILSKMNELEANIIQIEGLNIGVEICLDHAAHANYDGNVVWKGVLKTLSDNGKLPEGKPLDLQVLIACGMQIEAESVVSKMGVLRNDGMRGEVEISYSHLKSNNPFTIFPVYDF